MERRIIGGTDISVSGIGLGGLNFGIMPLEQSRRVIDAALDHGINFIDTANLYAAGISEEQLGLVLGDRRKDVVLATKFGLTVDGKDRGASRRQIVQAIEGSLRRLKTDWIDLYQLHMPDPETPMEETLQALDQLVCEGKVRYIGCSNLMAWVLVDSLFISTANHIAHYRTMQIEYNVLSRGHENEMIHALESKGVSLIPYLPLAAGMLSGKYRRGVAMPPDSRFNMVPQMAQRYATERNWIILKRLEDFAAARGRTVLDLAFAFLLARPIVCSVIAGATTAEQIVQNARAADWKLTSEEFAEINRLSRGV